MDLKNDSLVLSLMDGEYRYNRSQSIESMELSKRISKKYGLNLNNTIITPSGISAINVALQTILLAENNVNLIYSDQLYCDTPRLIKYWQQKYQYKTYSINVTKSENILKLFNETLKGQTNILFMESCSNPTGLIFDFSLVKKLRHLSKKLYLIVDNTWLTSEIFNPFEYDADIVVLSLTKYYSGGACICGAIVTKLSKLYNRMFDYIRITGLHVSPLNCKIVLDNLSSIQDRIKKSSYNCIKVLNYLKTEPKIKNLTHPFLNNHISFDLANIYFNKNNQSILYPSVFVFTISLNKNDAINWMKSSQIEYKTSFGSYNTKFDPYPQEVENGTICRISIGYNDDYQMIIDKLKYIITKLDK